MATTYDVEIKAGTKSATGGALGAAKRWSFTTLPPTLRSFYPRQTQFAPRETMVFVGFTACGPYPEALSPRLEGASSKILFGSDFPNIPYPLSHAVNGIGRLPLSRQAKRRILFDNAAALFGLKSV